MKQILTVKDAARIISRSEQTIRKYIKQNGLKASKDYAGQWVIFLDDLKEFVFANERLYKDPVSIQERIDQEDKRSTQGLIGTNKKLKINVDELQKKTDLDNFDNKTKDKLHKDSLETKVEKDHEDFLEF